LRGAASTGFRAPSLAQEYFSAISTNFIGGVPFDIGTFPVNTPAAKALGAKDLKAEQSTNLSVGATFDFSLISLTVDAYQIDIKDRVVFTENFIDSSGKKNVTNFLNSQGVIGAAGGRYFTNAVNTTTKGLDITARYGVDLEEYGKLRLTTAINFTKTEITNKSEIKTPVAIKAVTSINLFDRVEQGRFEVGQPRSTYNIIANYSYSDCELMIRTIRFGEVTAYQSNTDLTLDQTYSSKWVTDTEVSYRLLKNYLVAVGINNVFDVYPDKVLKVNSTTGILPLDLMEGMYMHVLL
jgi:iron complex outermembrane receptor protein